MLNLTGRRTLRNVGVIAGVPGYGVQGAAALRIEGRKYFSPPPRDPPRKPHRGEHDRYLGHYLETGERRIIGIGREVEACRKDGSIVPVDLAIGVIVIQYSPALEAVEIERIEELGRSFEDRVIVAPRPGMGAPVVATAWTTMMQIDAVDERLLREFYEQYVGRGPETGPCPFDVDEGA